MAMPKLTPMLAMAPRLPAANANGMEIIAMISANSGTENACVLLKILVIKNARAFAENPLPVRTEKGLHRLSLYLITNAVLHHVRIRNDVVIKCKQSDANHAAGYDDGNSQAVQTHSA